MKITFLILFLFLTTVLSAQEQLEIKKHRNEIGVNTFNLTWDQFKNNSIMFQNPIELSFFNGIKYRRVYDRNIFRSSIAIKKKKHSSFEYLEASDFAESYSYNESIYKIGYERILTKTFFNLKTYYSLDLFVLDSYCTRKFRGGYSNNVEEKELNYFGFGISPSFGLKYQLYKAFYLTIETNLEIAKLYETGTIREGSYSEINNTRKIQNSSFEYRFNPIESFVLSYSF